MTGCEALHSKIIDDFLIRGEWVSEGQLPVEAALGPNLDRMRARRGGNTRKRRGVKSSTISGGTSLRGAQD